MDTPIRTMRLSDKDWLSLKKMAEKEGYSHVTALIRAVARGEWLPMHSPLTYPSSGKAAVEEEATYDKDFDWGA